MELVVEAVAFDAWRFAAGDGGGECRPPFGGDFADESDVDVFAGDGARGEGGVEGEEVRDVGLDGGDEGGEVGGLCGGGEAFVPF